MNTSRRTKPSSESCLKNGMAARLGVLRISLFRIRRDLQRERRRKRGGHKRCSCHKHSHHHRRRHVSRAMNVPLVSIKLNSISFSRSMTFRLYQSQLTGSLEAMLHVSLLVHLKCSRTNHSYRKVSTLPMSRTSFSMSPPSTKLGVPTRRTT
jgi:hypothetical protein